MEARGRRSDAKRDCQKVASITLRVQQEWQASKKNLSICLGRNFVHENPQEVTVVTVTTGEVWGVGGK